MTADYRFATLDTFVGREAGASPWVVVDDRAAIADRRHPAATLRGLSRRFQ